MKKLIVLLVLSALFAAQETSAATLSDNERLLPAEALQQLLDGNKRFAEQGVVTHLDSMVSIKRRLKLAQSQHPIAVVLACSDSRVPPELLFDMGLGEIFTVRIAGNVIGPHEIGSIEYAVDHLGVGLVIVLGHERCGAVTAAYEAYVSHKESEGNIGSIVESINPAISSVIKNSASGTKDAMIEQCSLENIRMNAGLLGTHSTIIKEKLAHGSLQLISAYYDLDEGRVVVIK